jgi:probable HAF family extracellular repeat protein
VFTTKGLRRFLALCLVLGGTASVRSQAAPIYTLTDFGYAIPLSINDSGDVVLSGNAAYSGVYHAYGANAGHVTSASSYGLGSSDSLLSINNAGQVTGQLNQGTGTPGNAAYTASVGQLNQVPLVPGATGGSAVAENASGQVLIVSNGPVPAGGSGVPQAYLYSNGQFTNLGTLGGSTNIPAALNDAGQVTGSSNPSDSLPPHAYLYSGGKLTDLGTLGGQQSIGLGINASGEVTGSAQLAGSNFLEHAFLYMNGKMIDLGTLGPGLNSEGLAINGAGQVVGDSGGRAFIWQSGSMLDLNNLLKNDPGFMLNFATGVNSLGQIIGMSDVNGQMRGWMLTPDGVATPAAIVPEPAPVPEPATASLFIAGVGTLAGYRHWRASSKRTD